METGVVGGFRGWSGGQATVLSVGFWLLPGELFALAKFAILGVRRLFPSGEFVAIDVGGFVAAVVEAITFGMETRTHRSVLEFGALC